MKGYRQKCKFGFLVKQYSCQQKLSWSFLIKFTASYYLATPPPRGYSPMKMSGVLVEKVPKTYFVGVAWTLFKPLRDTISVSNNRNKCYLLKKYNYDFSHFFQGDDL